jgi:hypothetical protein
MKRTIGVFLGDTPRRVGTLRFDAQGARQHAGFEYHPDWLTAPGRFALEPAPVFDINPFPERVHELKTWISEDTGPESSIDALMSTAAYFRIDQAAARLMLGKIVRATSRWREIGRSIGMSGTELDPFETAFEHDEYRIARSLAGI